MALTKDDYEFTEDIKEADTYISGEVKWDGCSNWDFDVAKDIMLHGCSKKDLTRIGEVMGICWDWTAELCEHWCE